MTVRPGIDPLQRLRRALDDDGFRLFYQRIDSLRGKPALHEILVRMKGLDGDLVSPGHFVPLAEGHDMASRLDLWVIGAALDLLGSGESLGEEQITLNLSGQSLTDEVFLKGLVELVGKSAVEPKRLFFEITETYAVVDFGRALDFIGALRSMGCRFILDDFGSGWSSFAYLKTLPVDILKIDGQFVRDLDRDPIARAIVASIHEIAHLMGLETIAEWVEDQAALDIVQEMGVDYVQGFFLHRPRPLSP